MATPIPARFTLEFTMARNALISEKRLKLIEQRQLKPGWGPEYQPSIRATRDEAPANSRPSTVFSKKLGRDIHLLSLAERAAALLVLYHPGLFELREQHMLSPFRTPHPLADYLGVLPADMPMFEGTIDVADRLGRISDHPVVWVTKPDGNQVRAAFPYLGDLLLFLRDSEGCYCVNWTVKKDPSAFSLTPHRLYNPLRVPKAQARAEHRHHLEELYFSDAGIRTARVSEAEIDSSLIANLTALFSSTNTAARAGESETAYIVAKFQELVGLSITPLSILPEIERRTGVDRLDCVKILYAAIWNREVRVDLYRPVLPDKPLRRERSDVLVDYSHWFAR
ncbi:hypothetical protein [Achromobacter marplatensis]|uniref:hypothetical protein n=1 Tax=Achromobacter marplatensis TaxID=470868 RepID=UPI0028F133A9|nr:hypothetical protein [Achromobacter marplatensis]